MRGVLKGVCDHGPGGCTSRDGAAHRTKGTYSCTHTRTQHVNLGHRLRVKTRYREENSQRHSVHGTIWNALA